jgi:hypothetical protein
MRAGDAEEELQARRDRAKLRQVDLSSRATSTERLLVLDLLSRLIGHGLMHRERKSERNRGDAENINVILVKYLLPRSASKPAPSALLP